MRLRGSLYRPKAGISAVLVEDDLITDVVKAVDDLEVVVVEVRHVMWWLCSGVPVFLRLCVIFYPSRPALVVGLYSLWQHQSRRCHPGTA